MNTNVDQFTQWLDEHNGQTLSIQKGEHETGSKDVLDIDLISLELQSVEVRSANQNTQDDYLPSEEVILYGEGYIHGDDTRTPLPDNYFEIPLDETFKFHSDGNEIKVETEKALYRISTN
ncbi:hypothetical protein BTR22_09640 [Alkalihalophilus pseudofirmus]|uniref:hypothetical protein n=1 Tax=Alkalihalophilus pseudofirmus TaxID=79885 RepID=UPI000950D58B|nr:hypothetical protein BTR22_09640 [Alkalihalophilus pseudofirmus]